MTSHNDPKDQHSGLLIFDVDSKYDVAMLTLLHTAILHIPILRQPERKEFLNSSSLYWNMLLHPTFRCCSYSAHWQMRSYK